MKTYNFKFTSLIDLEKFCSKHSNIKNSSSILIQIFSGLLDKQLLIDISTNMLNFFPNSKIIGASTSGEIIENEVTINNIIISFTIFEKSHLTIDFIDNVDIAHSYEAGQSIAIKLKKDDSKVFILFGDGLNINGEEFLNGVKNKAKNITVSGGLAGDNATFIGTYVTYQNTVLQNAVVGVSINSENLIVNNGYSFAWQNIGRKFIVNRADKATVFEIDGMTPVKLYEKYLGEDIARLLPAIGIEFPLIIQDGDMNIARAVLAKNDDGSLVFAGNIKEGSIVRFGVGDTNKLLTDAFNLAKNISKEKSQSIFIYSCMARRSFLDTQASADIKNFSKISNVSGFFTYGEFFTINGDYKLLNETLTVLSLSEKYDCTDNVELVDYHSHSSAVTTMQALSHLVNITSNELEYLNDNLEKKVSSEIQKNIENEKKLFNSMKMSSLGDMIGNIAHQWRQPLSIITTSSSGMQIQNDMGILDKESFKKYTDLICYQANHLSDTINTFRDFVKDDYILADIVLQDDIDTTLKLLDVVLKDHNIVLNNCINYASPVTLKLIKGELSQVIINIFNNAKDALIENNISEKWIKISLENDDKNYYIIIEDNAGGVPKEILTKIFEPYFTTKHKSSGTGIGLYMSYDIVAKHFKGNLYVKNSIHGAKFFIEIPKQN